MTKNRKEVQAAWNRRNRNKLSQYGRKRRDTIKQEVLDHYGRVCQRCGFSDERALQLDHVNDDGAAERHAAGRPTWAGYRFYQSLKARDWPGGYQTLCANCNVIKQVELLSRRPLLLPTVPSSLDCEWCGESFVLSRIDKRFCSDACRLRALRSHRRGMVSSSVRMGETVYSQGS